MIIEIKIFGTEEKNRFFYLFFYFRSNFFYEKSNDIYNGISIIQTGYLFKLYIIN